MKESPEIFAQNLSGGIWLGEIPIQMTIQKVLNNGWKEFQFENVKLICSGNGVDENKFFICFDLKSGMGKIPRQITIELFEEREAAKAVGVYGMNLVDLVYEKIVVGLDGHSKLPSGCLPVFNSKMV